MVWLKKILKKLNAFSQLSSNFKLITSNFTHEIRSFFSVVLLRNSGASNISNATLSRSPFSNSVYRFLLLNQILDKVTKSNFVYIVFRFFNKSNYILNKNMFFWWLDNARVKYTLKQTDFYKDLVDFNTPNSHKFAYGNFLVGFRSMWLSLRFWFLPVYLGVFAFLYMSFLRLVTFNILLVKCLMLFGVFYWLFSGFTFFLKKYQYRYFTSSLQRFWKRCYAIFWMLEFFTFSVFCYLTMMGSQEPFLMYDNAQIFKTHLFSWRYFILKIFMSTVLIIFTYFLIIAAKWTTISKLDVFLMLITFILVYMVWVEFYQFFHVISYYGNLVWKLSEDTNYWYLETDYKKTRINNHFMTICLMAKFWHIVFTLVFWMFFVLRGLEMSRVRYPLLVANFQNFIFIYLLAWIYMYPWLKYATLKLFNTPYYWFFINNKRTMLYIFFSDYVYLLRVMLEDLVFLIPNTISELACGNSKVVNSDFYYYHGSGYTTPYTQYQKNYIRDYFIKFMN